MSRQSKGFIMLYGVKFTDENLDYVTKLLYVGG